LYRFAKGGDRMSGSDIFQLTRFAKSAG